MTAAGVGKFPHYFPQSILTLELGSILKGAALEMRIKNLPAQAYLTECFRIDELDGKRLIWLERPLSHFPDKGTQLAFNLRFAGKIAGCYEAPRYPKVGLDGETFLIHRVIFVMANGWSPREIDHRDLDKKNPSPKNLRPATSAQNHHNTAKRKSNTTGFKGVIRAPSGRYVARVMKAGKNHCLGTFDNPLDAHAAVDRATKRLHGEFARS